MNKLELKELAEQYIENIRDWIWYPKENEIIDYKQGININNNDNIDNFLKCFLKDILSFWNWEGWIIFLWFQEDDWKIEDIWLNPENLKLLKEIDLNELSQQVNSITGQHWDFDLQEFKISNRCFYYFLIPKNSDILVPKKDCKDLGNIKKWDIFYRIWWKNQLANESTSELNKFIQVKANEKSKEFMEIWSNLLPEMVDINPKEVLILNPIQNKIYWFNGANNSLSGSDIEIVQDDKNVFNVILETIKSWDIWKITDNEGKPIYRIVWDIRKNKEQINLNTLIEIVKKEVKLGINWDDIKKIMYYLWWVSEKKFNIVYKNGEWDKINFIKNDNYLWFFETDSHKKAWKIVFSETAVSHLVIAIKSNDIWNILWRKPQSI